MDTSRPCTADTRGDVCRDISSRSSRRTPERSGLKRRREGGLVALAGSVLGAPGVSRVCLELLGNVVSRALLVSGVSRALLASGAFEGLLVPLVRKDRKVRRAPRAFEVCPGLMALRVSRAPQENKASRGLPESGGTRGSRVSRAPRVNVVPMVKWGPRAPEAIRVSRETRVFRVLRAPGVSGELMGLQGSVGSSTMATSRPGKLDQKAPCCTRWPRVGCIAWSPGNGSTRVS